MFVDTDVSEDLVDLPSSGFGKKGVVNCREQSSTLVPICTTLRGVIFQAI